MNHDSAEHNGAIKYVIQFVRHQFIVFHVTGGMLYVPTNY